MIIPVRCFSCGKVIASTYVKFTDRVNEIRASGKDPSPNDLSSILDSLGVDRYCCRRMILSHTDLIDEILPFS
ncbi:MAG: DNA-directed RNA polymerase subunit N [Thermoplasmataceae archaeon]